MEPAPEMDVELFLLYAELKALENGIFVTLTSRMHHGFYIASDLYAYNIVSLSFLTYFVSGICMFGTFVMKVLFAHPFHAWSIHVLNYFMTSSLRPRPIFFVMVVRLFCHPSPYLRTSARNNTRRWLSSQTAWGPRLPAIRRVSCTHFVLQKNSWTDSTSAIAQNAGT